MKMGGDVYSVAVVALHPIQYQVGLWREMAQHPRLRIKVFFLDAMGVDGTLEPTLDVPLEWDMPMLDGYDHEFVPNLSPARFTPFVNRINPSVISRLISKRFDAIMVHGWHPISNWLALLGARLSGAMAVYRGEGTLVGQPGGAANGKLATPKLALNRLFLRRFDLVAYSSEDNRNYQLARGAREESLFSMPCAVDNKQVEIFAAQATTREDYRRSLGLDVNTKIILTAGRFTPRKRFEDCIRALAQQKDVDTHLVIAGNGPEGTTDELRRCAHEAGVSKRVHFVGWLTPAKLVEAQCAADVFVMASSHDPSPKAMSEALAAGLPIVCSDQVGTCRELVQPGRNGCAFRCGDVGALSELLTELLHSPERLAQMGAESTTIARTNSFAGATQAFVDALDGFVLRAAE